MATVLKLDQQREAAAILLDLRHAVAAVDGFVANAPRLNDDEREDWDRADERVTTLRAELDALVLDRLGVGLDQIKEAIGC